MSSRNEVAFRRFLDRLLAPVRNPEELRRARAFRISLAVTQSWDAPGRRARASTAQKAAWTRRRARR